MAKLYKVTIPAGQPAAGTHEVVAANEKAVRNLICKDTKRQRIPWGTSIDKIGLTKDSITTSIFSMANKKTKTNKPSSKPSKALKKSKSSTVNDVSRVPKRRGRPPKVKKEITESLEKAEKASKRREAANKKAEEKEIETKKDTIRFHGYSLRKSEVTKIPRKTEFNNCTMVVCDTDFKNMKFVCLGEDFYQTFGRGTLAWIICDRDPKNANIKALESLC
jgi:hypothetical protein